MIAREVACFHWTTHRTARIATNASEPRSSRVNVAACRPKASPRAKTSEPAPSGALKHISPHSDGAAGSPKRLLGRGARLQAGESRRDQVCFARWLVEDAGASDPLVHVVTIERALPGQQVQEVPQRRDLLAQPLVELLRRVPTCQRQERRQQRKSARAFS